MPLPQMIHFFGPDGAGKSTQVELLIEILKKKESKVKKCWIRSPHTLAFLLWLLFVKIGFYRVARNPFGVEIKLPSVDRSKLLRSFWALMEFFSVLPLILRIRFSIFRGYKFVAERFVLDTVTTVAYFINDLGFLGSRIARLLIILIPRNTVFIFLNSDYETIYRRRAPLLEERDDGMKRKGYGAIPEIAVEPREFIDFQRTAYKALAKHFDALEIDTSTNSIEETTNAILEYLESSRFHALSG